MKSTCFHTKPGLSKSSVTDMTIAQDPVRRTTMIGHIRNEQLRVRNDQFNSENGSKSSWKQNRVAAIKAMSYSNTESSLTSHAVCVN